MVEVCSLVKVHQQRQKRTSSLWFIQRLKPQLYIWVIIYIIVFIQFLLTYSTISISHLMQISSWRKLWNKKPFCSSTSGLTVMLSEGRGSAQTPRVVDFQRNNPLGGLFHWLQSHPVLLLPARETPDDDDRSFIKSIYSNWLQFLSLPKRKDME